MVAETTVPFFSLLHGVPSCVGVWVWWFLSSRPHLTLEDPWPSLPSSWCTVTLLLGQNKRMFKDLPTREIVTLHSFMYIQPVPPAGDVWAVYSFWRLNRQLQSCRSQCFHGGGDFVAEVWGVTRSW